MDLNTITAVAHPQTRAQLPVWTAGDAWLAGGTWLFSEPQVHLRRLIDLAEYRVRDGAFDRDWLRLVAEREREPAPVAD